MGGNGSPYGVEWGQGGRGGEVTWCGVSVYIRVLLIKSVIVLGYIVAGRVIAGRYYGRIVVRGGFIAG